MQETPEQKFQRFEHQRCRIYQIADLFSVVFISIDAFAIRSSELYQSWAERWVHLANNLFMAVCALLLIWMLSQRRYHLAFIERLAFFLFTFDSLC